MNKNKKIITGIVAVVVAVALFFTGYFLSGKLFPKKSDTDAAQETTLQQETTLENSDEGTQSDENNTDDKKDETDYSYILDSETLGSGEFEISKAEYEYYCVSIYNSLISSAFQYDYYYGEGAGLLYTGYDWTKLPGEQKCSMELNGKTFKNYDEYIVYVAKEQLVAAKACAEYARLNSITLSEDELKEIDAFIEENRASCEAEGTELEAYLKQYYGDGMTEEIYRNIVIDHYIINKVDEVKSGLFESIYTSEDIEKEYNDNVNTYGQVSLRNYIIVADTDDSGAVYKAAMEAAEKEAQVFAGMVSDEKSFKQRASEKEKKNGNADYWDFVIEDRYTMLSNIGYEDLDMETSDKGLAKWAFDSSRKVGDIYIAEIKDVGYGVYMMVNPIHKPATTYTYDVRHILIKFGEEGSSSSIKLLNPADYDVTVDIDVYPDLTADPALYMKAQDILKQYLGGDCTEESFGELAKEYSGDGNASEGGIYKDVQMGKMVSAFENWSLDENRKKGDVGIVETEYGYHIMYYVDKKVVSDWEDTVKAAMVYDSVMDFTEKLTGNYRLSIESESDIELEALYSESIAYYSSFLNVQ